MEIIAKPREGYDVERYVAEAERAVDRFREIRVIHWGATMILADFFAIQRIEGSKREVAVRLQSNEYGEFGVSERTMPRNELTNSFHSVRWKDGRAQVFFASEWRDAPLWDGKEQIQNTCD